MRIVRMDGVTLVVVKPCPQVRVCVPYGVETTSYSDLRRNLTAMLDSVNADHEPVIITRDRGKPAAVLMSLADYASFEETRHLLKSPRNAERLLAATQGLDTGEGIERDLTE